MPTARAARARRDPRRRRLRVPRGLGRRRLRQRRPARRREPVGAHPRAQGAHARRRSGWRCAAASSSARGRSPPTSSRRFVACAAENGIDVFRLHDPLNDVSNLREAGEAIVAAGKEFDAGLVYSPGPTGETDTLVEQARRAARARRRARPRSTTRPARSQPHRADELVARARARRPASPSASTARARPARARRRARGGARRRRPHRLRRLPARADAAPRLGRVAREALDGLGRDTGVDVDALWEAADLVDEHIGDEPVTPLAPRIAVRAAEHDLPAGLVAALDVAPARARRRRPARRGARRARARSAPRPAGRRSPRRSGRSSPRRRCSTCSPRAATAPSSTSSARSSTARYGTPPGADRRVGARAVELLAGRRAGRGGSAERRRGARARPRASPRARRSSSCSRCSARRPSRCCRRSAQRHTRRRRRSSRGDVDADARRAHPRARPDRAGVRRRRDRDRGRRACASRCAAPTSCRRRARRARCAPLAEERAGEPPIRRRARRRRPRRVADGRHLLPRAAAGRAAVRRGGRRRRSRPDALHPRGDEADQRGQGRASRAVVRAIHVENGAAGRVRAAAVRARAARRPPLDASDDVLRASSSRTAARSRCA